MAHLAGLVEPIRTDSSTSLVAINSPRQHLSVDPSAAILFNSRKMMGSTGSRGPLFLRVIQMARAPSFIDIDLGLAEVD